MIEWISTVTQQTIQMDTDAGAADGDNEQENISRKLQHTFYLFLHLLLWDPAASTTATRFTSPECTVSGGVLVLGTLVFQESFCAMTPSQTRKALCHPDEHRCAVCGAIDPSVAPHTAHAGVSCDATLQHSGLVSDPGRPWSQKNPCQK